MSSDPDDRLASVVGSQLRRLRTQSALSLEGLSKLARVSRGMLSQIELGRSTPTITVLSRIAAALGVPVAAFLSRDSQDGVTVLRRSEAQLLRSADGSFVSRALFPFQGERRTEFYELQLQTGCRHQSPAHAAGTTENLVVATGLVRVDLQSTTHELPAGDALFFAADVAHAYVNVGPDAATLYVVVEYPEPVRY